MFSRDLSIFFTAKIARGKGVKNLLYALMVSMSVWLTGCRDTKVDDHHKALQAWMEPNEKLKVLSTTAMIDDLVASIGQDYILHQTLIQGQLDPHGYELVKGDGEKIGCADLIFYNGLELEHGASLKYQLTHQPKAYALGDMLLGQEGVDLIFLEGQVDPHIWMDIDLFSHAIDPLVEKMSLYDPEHAQIFFENGQKLKKQMDQLDQKIYQQMQNIPSQSRYLITSHDAFFYFARRYLAESSEYKNQTWKERFAAPEGLAPDGQISPLDIQVIIDYALTHHVQALFPESNLNQDALRKIIEVLNQKGARVVLAKEPLYGDTLGDIGSGAETYLQMMEYNANQISLSLQGKDEK